MCTRSALSCVYSAPQISHASLQYRSSEIKPCGSCRCELTHSKTGDGRAVGKGAGHEEWEGGMTTGGSEAAFLDMLVLCVEFFLNQW